MYPEPFKLRRPPLHQHRTVGAILDRIAQRAVRQQQAHTSQDLAAAASVPHVGCSALDAAC